ncbi:MAG: radical SAM protein, partial [Schlesneria sp.]
MTLRASEFSLSNEAKPPSAAYFHVPFCAHRCGYCDFTLIAGRDDLVSDYLRSLDLEIERSRIPPGTPLATLFFGGGTPTHPKPAEMRHLFETTRRYFDVSATTEFSVEANPLDLTDEKIDLLVEMG